MWEIILISVIALLTVLLLAALFFLWKFSKIIMVFEDDLSEATNSLNEVEDALKAVLEMQMFFDSPEIKQAVQGVLENVKLCRLTIAKVVQRFTARSKRQYVTVWDLEEPGYDSEQPTPRLPGQPPGTPNPLEAIRREGMVLDVRRPGQR
jgi:hypothetical protein